MQSNSKNQTFKQKAQKGREIYEHTTERLQSKCQREVLLVPSWYHCWQDQNPQCQYMRVWEHCTAATMPCKSYSWDVLTLQCSVLLCLGGVFPGHNPNVSRDSQQRPHLNVITPTPLLSSHVATTLKILRNSGHSVFKKLTLAHLTCNAILRINRNGS